MTGPFTAGLLAGYGVAVPVGAIAILVMSLTARTSVRTGVAAGLGVATADGGYAAVAVIGGTALAGLIVPVAVPLRWAAVLILLLLASHQLYQALRQHRDPVRAARGPSGLATPVRAYFGLLGLTLLNPATVVYFTALVLGRQTEDRWPAAGAALFVCAVFLASASWQLLVALGGALLGRALGGPTGRLVTALVSSALIVLMALLLL